MRKTLIALLVVAFLASTALWAGKADIKALELGNKAAGLDQIGKQMLFEANKKTLGWPLGLNLTLGAGIGSFVQGDVAGGMIGLVGDAAAYGLAAYGLAQGFADLITLIIKSAVAPGDVAASETSLWLMGGGAALWLASRIYQGIRPAQYAKTCNNKIRSSIFGDADLALAPVMGADGPKVALVGSIGF